MTEIAPRMARAGFESVTVPKGARRSDMGLPKPRIRRVSASPTTAPPFPAMRCARRAQAGSGGSGGIS